MKIILTGGHLSPALAMIEAFPKTVEVLIVGRKHTFEGDSNPSFEYKTAQARGIPFASITTGRLQRTFTRYTIPSLFKFPLGFFQAYRIVKDFKPDLVLSFGSYVSVPVVIISAILQIPIVIHEQTLGAGLANRIASFFAKKVCISWESSRKFFPKSKVVVTGNPIRKFTVHSSQFEATNKEQLPLIYITGGSAGSHTINVLVEGCLEKLLKEFHVIHQTGDSWQCKDFERLQKLRQTLDAKLKERYILTKFVDSSDVGFLITASSVVVSRSGINTITELIYFGKQALLIPLNNEQMENALFAKNLGFAEVANQNALTSNTLYNLIVSMVNAKEKLSPAKEGKSSIKEDAEKRIIQVIESVVKEKK